MVLNTLAPKLAALKPLAAELNQSSDLFTEELKRVEAELNELGLGVVVENNDMALFASERSAVDANDIVNGEHGRWRTQRTVGYLAFGQTGNGRWRLLSRNYRHLENAEENEFLLVTERPLLEESREIRLAAADALPGLLHLMAVRAKEKVSAVKAALQK